MYNAFFIYISTLYIYYIIISTKSQPLFSLLSSFSQGGFWSFSLGAATIPANLLIHNFCLAMRWGDAVLAVVNMVQIGQQSCKLYYNLVSGLHGVFLAVFRKFAAPKFVLHKLCNMTVFACNTWEIVL